MPTAANANIERASTARVALARPGGRLKSAPARARSTADIAARRRELARLLRTIRGMLRQPT